MPVKHTTNLYLPFEKGCFVYKRGSEKFCAQRIFADKTQITKMYDNKEEAMAFVDSMKNLMTRPMPLEYTQIS